MTKHIAVLSNPEAGKGRGRRAADAAVSHLRALGAEVREYVGRDEAETISLAGKALEEQPDALVVVGGDGTVSGILDSFRMYDIPLVLVPAGTGNDLARALDLPRHDPAAAAALALEGTPRSIDVGEVSTPETTRAFLTVAALGFDAKVSDRTNQLRWPRGRLRYYLALVIELLRLRPVAFEVTIDDGHVVKAPGTLIAVGNTSSYGGGMPMCADAVFDDGLLDVVQVAPLGRLRLVAMFPLLLRGKHLGLPEVSARRARTITVRAPDLVVYADGERIGEGECTVRLLERGLTVMTRSGT